MAASTASTSPTTSSSIAIPYWPTRAVRVAAVGGCSAIVFLDTLRYLRDPPPASTLRGAIMPVPLPRWSFPDDIHTYAMVIWFICLVLISLVTTFSFSEQISNTKAPYWPLRAVRIASTSSSCALACLGLYSHYQPTAVSALLRGTATNTPGHDDLQPGCDLSHAVMMVVLLGLAVITVSAHMYASSGTRAVPHWPLHAVKLASAVAFCTLLGLRLLTHLQTGSDVIPSLSEVGHLRGQRGAALQTNDDFARVGLSAKYIFYRAGAPLVLLTFASYVYREASSLSHLQDAVRGGPKKPKKIE